MGVKSRGATFCAKITTTLSGGRDCNVMPCRAVSYERLGQSSNNPEIFHNSKKLLCGCLNLGTYHQNATLHHPAQGLQNQNGGGKSDIAVIDDIHLLYLHTQYSKLESSFGILYSTTHFSQKLGIKRMSSKQGRQRSDALQK